MKKIVGIFIIITLLSVLIFTSNSYAIELNTINVQTDKTTVRPGEEVKVNIQFGQELGAYTFDVSYDNNIFEYVTVDGGTENNTTGKVRITYYDSTGGSNSRNYMSVVFRAKSDITTSNPTEFTITAEGLANSDASVTFDDITTPIIKNITVEPKYIDYTLKLEHNGSMIKDEENEVTISYSSPMGRYYEHARLIAEAKTPSGANVQLLATDRDDLEHDIIQSGWGDAQGYKIGGKDVLQVLQARAIFSQKGNYTITLKLIDRDNSDQVISEQDFDCAVVETATEVTPPTIDEENSETITPETEELEEVKTEEVPTRLPKTGANIYIPIIVVLIILVNVYVYYNKKK